MDETKIKYSSPFNILIVEDNQVDLRMLEGMLKEEIHPQSVRQSSQTLSDALICLEKNIFHAVILDLNLPDSQGVNTLRKINEKHPGVAIVINTGAYEEELGLEALGYGAQDFLVKGKYNSYTLVKMLRFAVERKRLEAEVKEIQAQLIQSEKMKTVGSLASGVAHEVRNPLATIKYGVKYLIDQLVSPDEKVKMVLKGLDEAADRANLIITDLLDFSSLNRLNKSSEDLNAVTEKALGLVEHYLIKSHIKVSKEFDAQLPRVPVDKNRVEQVIVNLLLNAIYAMPEGGTIVLKTSTTQFTPDLKDKLEVQSDFLKPENSVILLVVEDTGCGIPKDKVKEIFNPFFTTRRAKGGTGLGLSICKSIVDIHQGHIHIANKETQGVRVTLVFKI